MDLSWQAGLAKQVDNGCHQQQQQQQPQDAVTEFFSRTLNWLLYVVEQSSPIKIATTRSSKRGHSNVLIDIQRPFSKGCPLKHRLIYLLYLYTIGYSIWLTFRGIGLQRHYTQWQPKVSLRAPQNNSCVLKRDIELESGEHARWLHLEALRYGHPSNVPKLNNIGEFLYFVIAGTCLIMLIMTNIMLLRKKPVRSAVLSFLLDSEAERKRARSRLKWLAKKTFNDPEQSEQLDSLLAAKCQCSWRPRKIGHEEQQQQQQQQQQHDSDAQSRQQFLAMLERLELHLSVRPKSLQHRYKKMYSLMAVSMWLATIFTSLATLVLALYYITYKELESRVSDSLEKAKCERWHPEGQLEKHELSFDNKFWQDNRLAYVEFNPNQDSIWTLYKLELGRLLMTTNYLLLVLNYIVCSGCLTSWISFYGALQIVEFAFQMLWLGQLNCQCSHVNKLMSLAILEQSRPIRASLFELFEDKQLSQVRQHVQASKRARLLAIHEANAITILNFSTFAMQYPDFRWIANHTALYLVCQVFNTFNGFYLAYLTGLASLYSPIVLGIALGIIGLLNLAFVSSSLIVSRIRKIRSSLLLMLAKSSELAISQSYQMSVVRRHLLNGPDFEFRYAMSLFGVTLSSNNVIKLDSYLLGVLLIIYRQSC